MVYTYAPGRGGEHLEKLLANYRGIVQCDGYAPYKRLPADRITVAFCWSHLRREFFKITERGDAPTASEAVARIAQIYAVEKDVRGAGTDARRAARQARSRPLTDALRTFFEQQLGRLSGGSDTAKTIRYGLRHWDGLTRFLDDGRIELDTNIVERSMRPQALTRKNALFAGHDDGAENWAILGLAHRNSQTVRHRSPSLARRYPHPPGQSLAQQSSRRTPALDVGRSAPVTKARRLNRYRASHLRRSIKQNPKGARHRLPTTARPLEMITGWAGGRISENDKAWSR